MTLINRFEGDNVLIVYFQDVRIIDDSRISSLGQELGELINNTSNSRIILNFQNVGFMSSAMIGKLVLFGKKCKEAKVKLRLCTIGDNVDEVFKLMRLNKVFDIDKNIIGTAINDINVRSYDELIDTVKSESIEIAAICVPAPVAQKVCNDLVSAGIKAILNYSRVRLKAPSNISIQYQQVICSFMQLTYQVSHKN